MTRPARGFSLIELLMVLLILALVGLGCASVLASMRRPDETVAASALRLHRRGLSLALLREDLGRNLAASERSIRVALGTTDVVAVIGPAPESLLLSEYSVGVDGGARANLYRRSGAASRQPAVQGVVDLDVLALHRRERVVPVHPGSYQGVVAIDLLLEYSWGERVHLHLPLGTETTVEVP